MKLKTIQAEIERALNVFRDQAEKIKDCCGYGRKKYKKKNRLCTRCRQRLNSIITKTS